MKEYGPAISMGVVWVLSPNWGCMETCSIVYCQNVFYACQQGVGMGPEGQGTRKAEAQGQQGLQQLPLTWGWSELRGSPSRAPGYLKAVCSFLGVTKEQEVHVKPGEKYGVLQGEMINK